MFFSASVNSDDDERVSFQMRNAPLKAALAEITRQTQINFIYANRDVDSIKIDCQFSETPVEEAVRALLQNTPLAYKRTQKREMVIFRRRNPSSVSIAGVVVDADNHETLPYVNIALKNSPRGTSTNSEGRFFLPQLQTFPCTLQVNYVGYSPRTLIVHEQAASQDLRISLRQAPLAVPPVTIHADNWEAFEVSPAPSQLAISPQHFSDLPIIGDKDISRSLQLMPGIVTSSYGASGLHIRGGLPSQNLILLDGMTLYHMNHAFGFFSAFDAEAIKDVRVYKGNIPAKFGGRLSGVMELAAKTGDWRRAHASVGVNPMSGQTVLEVPLFGKGALLLSGRRSFSKFILSSLYDRVFRRLFNYVSPIQVDQNKLDFRPEPNRDHDIYFHDALTKATFMLTRNDVLTLGFYTGFDQVASVEDYFIRDTTVALKQEDFLRQNSKWGNTGVSAKWYRQWRENLHSTALMSFSDYSMQYYLVRDSLELTPPFSLPRLEFDTQNDIEDFSLRLDSNWQHAEHHTLNFGLAYTQSKLLFKTTNYAYHDPDLRKNTVTSEVPTNLISAYAEHIWKPTARSSLRSGLRANRYGVRDDRDRVSDPSNAAGVEPTVDWEPRLSIEYRFSKIFAVKGAWNRHYQYLMQFGDDLPIASDEDSFSWIVADRKRVQSSFAEHLVAGAQVGSPDFLLDVEFYHKNLQNVFDNFDYRQFAVVDGVDISLIQYPGYADGVDVLLQKKTGDLTSWLSYSWSRCRTQLAREGKAFSVPSTQDTPHNLKLVGSLAAGNWNFSATWQYLSGRPYSIPKVSPYAMYEDDVLMYILLSPKVYNTRRLPATHRLDVSVTRMISSRYLNGKIGLSVFNLYDRRNIWYRYFTIRGGKLAPVDVHVFGATPTLFLELRW